jgi:hypothetical protein
MDDTRLTINVRPLEAIHSSGRRPVPVAKTGIATYRGSSSPVIASTSSQDSKGTIGFRSWRLRFGFAIPALASLDT